MRKDLQKKYDALAATGTFTEDELARLRAGFEKPPRKINVAKSMKHMETVEILQMLERKSAIYSVEWTPEGVGDDPNAYIEITLFRHYVTSGKNRIAFEGEPKADLDRACRNADEVYFELDKNSLKVTLCFRDIIQEGSWNDEP